mmetsp:Transcript_30013/g.94674  ORF Transcript_30013/g.94674 Transcript_30013/m.94674 type:complete len:146 (-) Transcript_30013:785-1222(-)
MTSLASRPGVPGSVSLALNASDAARSHSGEVFEPGHTALPDGDRAHCPPPRIAVAALVGSRRQYLLIIAQEDEERPCPAALEAPPSPLPPPLPRASVCRIATTSGNRASRARVSAVAPRMSWASRFAPRLRSSATIGACPVTAAQ